MCRIYGFLGSDPGPDALAAASKAQFMGGPDEQSWISGEGWGLGCNRLAIQGPATGSQPFSSRDGLVQLVFNGEIYNFRELGRRLAARGIPVRGESDGSVLLPGYLEFGDGFVEQLEGMFAIAVVDLRGGRPELKLWCDPLAVKSLYYTRSGGGFAFASEIAGLTALRGDRPPLDLRSIDRYLDLQCLPNGETLFHGVHGLEPGEQLTYDGTEVRHRKVTWRPVDVRTPRTPGELRELLAHEVDRMCQQETPVAVQVSGGLDSAVLATMLRRRRDDVRGFHVTFEGDHPANEHRYAVDAAEHAGVPLETVEIAWDDLPGLIPEVVAALGSPNATPHAVSAYVLFREIARQGYRVCFVGDGADEQFGGYRRYTRALADRTGSWELSYVDRLALVPAAEYTALYTDDYRDLLAHQGTSRDETLRRLRAPASSRLEALLAFDLHEKLPSLNLRKLDHLSMAHSVEGRVPYCQPALTRFAAGLPDEAKVDGDRRKPILWRAAAGLIPDSVMRRAKQPFTLPVEAALRPGHSTWTFLNDVMAGSALCAAGVLDRSAVDGVLAAHREGRDQSRLLWGLMVLELAVR